ncbi:glycoprotein [Schistocephalus solidus rhabdovirus]|uniref:Glycoprotein n=1 Tax=Schistocephalus solidus rhabdovirus TaxID=2729339 RepID=A0A6M3RUH3_9RHAB|nr:glycoprotein [Schistocephalus solidus rhabdovirus]
MCFTLYVLWVCAILFSGLPRIVRPNEVKFSVSGVQLFHDPEEWEKEIIGGWWLNGLRKHNWNQQGFFLRQLAKTRGIVSRRTRRSTSQSSGPILPLCPRLSEFKNTRVDDLDCNVILQNVSGLLNRRVKLKVVKREVVRVSEPWCACKYMESVRGCKKEFFLWDQKWGYDREVTGSLEECRVACSLLKTKITDGLPHVYQSKPIKYPVCWWMKGTEERTEYIVAVPIPAVLDKMRQSVSSSYVQSGICFINGPPCKKSNGLGSVVPLSTEHLSPPITEDVICMQPKLVPSGWIYCKVPTTGEVHIASKECGFHAFNKTYVETLNGVYIEETVPSVCERSSPSGRLPSMVDFPRPEGITNDLYQQFVSCNLHKAVIGHAIQLGTRIHSSLFDPFISPLGRVEEETTVIINGLKSLIKATCIGKRVTGLVHKGGDTWEVTGEEGPIGCIMAKLQIMMEGGCIRERGPPTVPVIMKSFLVITGPNGSSYEAVPTSVPMLEFLHGISNISVQLGIIDSILNRPTIVDYLPEISGENIITSGNSTGYLADLRINLLNLLGLSWVRPVGITILILISLWLCWGLIKKIRVWRFHYLLKQGEIVHYHKRHHHHAIH